MSADVASRLHMPLLLPFQHCHVSIGCAQSTVPADTEYCIAAHIRLALSTSAQLPHRDKLTRLTIMSSALPRHHQLCTVGDAADAEDCIAVHTDLPRHTYNVSNAYCHIIIFRYRYS
ncbi:hypothetical protein BHM03_00059731 [Ensete ventricosum]|uniref:Uncharacterized protein n=1 Tax=Ensete ventricosum TaxID=4639 RepID=A0A445MMP5_ENSVE|nr:hypothetical protein BHM03_00059731 [Ensete ventricosum]